MKQFYSRKNLFAFMFLLLAAGLQAQQFPSSGKPVSSVPTFGKPVTVMTEMLFEVPLRDRVNQSDLIVEGMVTSQHSFWDPNHHNIYTANTIQVTGVFKGNPSSTLVVITEGGEVGMDAQKVSHSLELSEGDVGLFMLHPSPVADPLASGVVTYRTYADLQGAAMYNLENRTASDVFHQYEISELYAAMAYFTGNSRQEIAPLPYPAQNKTGGTSTITSFSPTTITAGTKSILTITGTNFGSSQGAGFVEFKNADDGGSTFIQPIASQYISWSNTQIQVEVPDNAGTGVIRVKPNSGSTQTSSSSLTISYAQINVVSSGQAIQTRHVNDNGNGGYTWQYFTGFASNTNAVASFERALESWRCGTFMNWEVGNNTSVNVIASDGTNVVRFDIGSELPAGVLGRCTSRFSGCTQGGQIKFYVNELDIVFNDGTNWEFGPALPSASEYDFETVAVHELGHGHQLGHVISPGAIMHYAISNGSSNRNLSANDIAGGNFVMTQSTGSSVCGKSVMVALNAGNCALGGTASPIADFTSNVTTVPVGGSVNFTDLSTNAPTSWSWSFSGGSPATSTAQNPSGITYNTPGTYNVTLTATNAGGSDIETKTNYITVVAPGCDTLNWTLDNPSAYTTTGGYLPGHNGYGITEYANYFNNYGGNTHIFGGWFWFFHATSSGATAKITAKIYQDNSGQPGAVIASQDVLINDIIQDVNNSYLTYVDFGGPITIPGNFYMGFQLTYASGDTVALVMDQINGAGIPADQGWYKIGAGSWGAFGPAVGGAGGKTRLGIFPQVGIPPTAGFSGTPLAICENDQVSFTNSSSNGFSYLWDFQGGTPSTSSSNNPTITYATAGNYDVQLIVTGNCGLLDTITQNNYVSVNPTPVLNLTAGSQYICPGDSVQLSVSGATSYSWSPSMYVDDSTGANVWASPPTTMAFSVTGTTGSCSSVDAITIYVVKPTAAFGDTATNLTVNFSDSSQGSPVAWAWDFGDGNSSTMQNPSHTYATSGTYPVCLTVYDGNGCWDSTCTSVTVIAVGADAEDLSKFVEIWPNPSSGKFNMRYAFGNETEVEWQVMNVQGQLVAASGKELVANGKAMIDLDRMSAGIYFLKLKAGDKEMVRKLVVTE